MGDANIAAEIAPAPTASRVENGVDGKNRHVIRRPSVDPAPPQKRSEASLVRFTPDEFRAVTTRARECGLPPARFIREAALGAIPRARRTPANAELIRHLARIGTDLRRLVSAGEREANEQTMTSGVHATLAELLEVIRRVE